MQEELINMGDWGSAMIEMPAISRWRYQVGSLNLGKMLARNTNLGVFRLNMVYKAMRPDEINQNMSIKTEEKWPEDWVTEALHLEVGESVKEGEEGQ